MIRTSTLALLMLATASIAPAQPLFQQLRSLSALFADVGWCVTHSFPGFTRAAAEIIVAEVGVDMSRFPTAGHLASCVGICPGNHESAGKRLSGKTRKGNRWLKPLLLEAGWGRRTHQADVPRRQYGRLCRRRGKKKAAMAVGHHTGGGLPSAPRQYPLSRSRRRSF